MPEDPLTANIESPQIQILSVVEPSTPDAHSPLLGSPCIICQKQLAKKHCTPVSRLKPRFLKLMQLHFPKTAFRPTDSICKDHFATALQSRVDDLLEEDQFESSKLQEEAMKNIEKYEMEELTWKRQFDRDFTLGERCADKVAKKGGSWSFLIGLFVFLVSWIGYVYLKQGKQFAGCLRS